MITENIETLPLPRVYSSFLTHDNRLYRNSLINTDSTLPSINLTTQSQSRSSYPCLMNNMSSMGNNYFCRGTRMNSRIGRRDLGTRIRSQIVSCVGDMVKLFFDVTIDLT